MYRIIDGRGSGKTSRLMLIAKENDALFICANPYAMEQKALAYGIVGVEFIDYENAVCYYKENEKLNAVVDDIEAFAKIFLRHHNLIGYTLSNED